MQLHCMAHARRKLNDALGNNQAVAEHSMQEMQRLYAIERKCKEENLSFDEIKTVRQQQSAPILNKLGKWMKEQYIQALPKSSNSIRPVALGRKNYLFAGSHEAPKRSGMLYSLLGTCKMHGIELYARLKDVLQRIADHPINRISELLSHR